MQKRMHFQTKLYIAKNKHFTQSTAIHIML